MSENAGRDDHQQPKWGWLADVARDALEQAVNRGRAVSKTAAEQAEQLRNSRIWEHVGTAKEQAGHHLDTISGKAMYDLVRDRLELQDRYNNLLASKLQEALERIDELEKRLAERDKGGSRGDDS